MTPTRCRGLAPADLTAVASFYGAVHRFGAEQWAKETGTCAARVNPNCLETARLHRIGLPNGLWRVEHLDRTESGTEDSLKMDKRTQILWGIAHHKDSEIPATSREQYAMASVNSTARVAMEPGMHSNTSMESGSG